MRKTADSIETVRRLHIVISAVLPDQPFAQEREIPLAGDNQVIQQADIEQCRGACHTLGQRPVLPARLGGSRRMVMNQYQLGGKQLQRPFDDQPVVDHRTRHAALTHALALDDAVRRSEVARDVPTAV